MEHLPAELLLHIAAHLGGPKQNVDLCSLCLTSRQLRQAAQDVLFKAPKPSYQRRDNECSSTSLLVRTMIERPDLAKKIRHISWDASEALYPEKMSRLALNTAGLIGRYGTVSRACKEFVERSQLNLADWIEGIEEGNEEAYYGACLAFVPCLDSLDIMTPDHPPRKVRMSWLDTLFNCKLELLLDKLPAFQRLHSLTVNRTLPWAMISLPTLRHLQFGMCNLTTPLEPIPTGPQQLMLKSLVITVRDQILLPDVELIQKLRISFLYITELMRHTKHLEHLSIRIAWDPMFWPRHSQPTWVSLLSRVPPLDRLLSLEIDAADRKEGGLVNCIRRKGKQPAGIRAIPLESLGQFPALQRLVVPQSVIVDEIQEPDSAPLPHARLPTTLQAIEIIDSTNVLDEWAQTLLWDRHQYPNLKHIAKWCDRRMEPLERAMAPKRTKLNRPLPISSGGKVYNRTPIRKENGPESSTGPEQRRVPELNGVWKELRDSGVEVMMHGQEERLNWRRC
tara:strand:- start:14354 stop:15874 length:1521 start_codon:yes stop_codon:yes gene_type:complete